MGPFNIQGMLGVGAVALVAGFMAAQYFVSGEVVKQSNKNMSTVIANTWERENTAVDREINLYNDQISDRRALLEMSELVQKLDTVSGEAREALLAELKRRDSAIRAAQADAQAKADELRRYKTQWGDAPVPDGYVCRMRGEASCEAPAGGVGTPPNPRDRVAVRDGGR